MAAYYTYEFLPISVRRSKKGHRPVCGKRTQRSRTFTHAACAYTPEKDS